MTGTLTPSDELIGLAVKSPKRAGQYLSRVTESELDSPRSRLCYRTVMMLLSDGGSPTIQSISSRVTGAASREDVRRAFTSRNDVAEYLEHCVRSLGDDVHPETVLSTIELESNRRRITQASQELAQLSLEASTTDDLVTRAAAIMGDVVAPRGSSSAGVENIDGMHQWLDRRMSGVPPKEWDWPFPKWNKYRKMRGGDIIIPAALSGYGKSWLLNQFVESVCKDGGRAAVFSMEMSEDKLRERMILMGGHITRDDVDYKTFDFEKIRKRVDEISKWDYVTYTGRTDIKRIAAETTLAAVQGRPFDVIGIDHLALVRLDKKHGSVDGLDQFLEQLRTEIADRHQPVIVLLSQFRKVGEGGPSIEDLRGSAAIQQIADRVFILHKETEDAKVARIWNPKVRDGARLPGLDIELHEKLNRWVEHI